MLQTNLTHIETEQDFQDLIQSNENVMITCGRMGPMCIPVYDVMEKLEGECSSVTFRDMAFDGPVSHVIKSLPEVRSFQSLPFVAYYKNGELARATAGIQTKKQVKQNLEELFHCDDEAVAVQG